MPAYQVKFPVAGVGTVKDGKWSVPGFPSLETILDLETARLSRGPEIGFDFDWHAAEQMALQQHGKVISPPPPPGTYKTRSDVVY